MENTTKKANAKVTLNIGEINMSYKDISFSFEGEVEMVKEIATAIAETMAKANQQQVKDK